MPPGNHFPQGRLFQKSMLFQALAHQRQREARAKNRHVKVTQDVGQGADVIFVAVRQHNGAHLLAILLQVGDVRNDDVHAQQLGFRKHHAGVDHQDVIPSAQGEHVHAKFAQAAQRNGPKRRLAQLSCSSLIALSYHAAAVTCGIPDTN